MDKAEYDKLCASANAEYHKNLDAINYVYNLLHPELNAKFHNYCTKTRRVMQVIDNEFMSKEFTIRDMMDFTNLTNIFSMNNCFARLLKTNYIEVVTRGSGSSPSIYKKATEEQKEIK